MRLAEERQHIRIDTLLKDYAAAAKQLKSLQTASTIRLPPAQGSELEYLRKESAEYKKLPEGYKMELDKLRSEWDAWDRDIAYFGDNGSHYGTVRSEASCDPVPPPQMRIFPPKKEEKTEAENPGQDEWGGVCERGWGWLLPCHMVGPGPL